VTRGTAATLRILLVGFAERSNEVWAEDELAPRLADGLAAAGARVEIVSERGVRTYPSGAPSRSIIGSTTLSTFATGSRFDAVVDLDGTKPSLVAAAAGRTAARVLVLQDDPRHEVGPASRLHERLLRRVHRRSAVVVTTPALRAVARRALDLKGPMYVIRSGGSGIRIASRRADRPTVVCLVGPRPGTRVDRVVRSLPTLLQSWPDVTVQVPGFGSERSALEALAQRLGVASALSFGADATVEQLGSAWIAVDPSSVGGTLAATAAVGAGVPVVTFAKPGRSDLVAENTTGWTVHSDAELGAVLSRGLSRVADQWTGGPGVEVRGPGFGTSWEECISRIFRVVTSEVDRKLRPTPSRQSSDLTAVVELRAADALALAYDIAEKLRRTDHCRVEGSILRVYLYGCDELDADLVLQRAGITDAELRIASGRDLGFVA
jgi:glycosyltransferase involved in cell wall biosynthesis